MLPPAASTNRNRATTLTPPPHLPANSTDAPALANFATSIPATGSYQSANRRASGLSHHQSHPTGQTHITLAPRQITTTVVTTTTTRTTDFPSLRIPPAPLRSRFDRETYPLAATPTPPSLKNFTFDLNGISTSVSELEECDIKDSFSATGSGAHPRNSFRSPATASHSSTDYAESPLGTYSRKRPISPEQVSMPGSAGAMHEKNLAFTSITTSLPATRAHKRRGSIGSSSGTSSSTAFGGSRSANSEFQRITSAPKPHVGAVGPIPIPLTPFPEANPLENPHAPDIAMSDHSAMNLPSPTASPTQATFSHEVFEHLPMATVSHVAGDANSHQGDITGVGAIADRWPMAVDIPLEFASLPALGDIPHILTTFDTLPTPLKSYLLLQLLRRCPFSTLQFVSSLILPSLKRDYIGLLPVELGYQVLQFLDLRSLGRCAAVSKKWKHVVDGDGADLAVWKRRLISEGWYDDSEVRDKISPSIRPSSSRRASRNPNHMEYEGDMGHVDRPIPINGRQARDDWPVDWEEYGSLLHNFRRPAESVSQGLEVPANLYKNLFRRHHLIRQNWFHGRYRHISFPGHAFNVVTCLQFDADKIVSGSDDQTIHIYDTRTGELTKNLQGHEGGVWALQYWNDVLVSGSTDRTVRVWDMDTGKCTHLFQGHTSTVRCLLIIIPHKNHETGRMEPEVPLVVTGSRDATLRVWRLPHPKRDAPWNPENTLASPAAGDAAAANPFFKHCLRGHSDSVRAIAGYGNRLVSGSYDSTVRIWNIDTGTVVFICRGHREKVYSVGYSHELRRAVSGSMDASVKIWCTNTGTLLFDLTGHTSLVGLLELSPQYLVSAAADTTLRVWSPTTGHCLANLTGHAAAITCFHHDPRLNRIVSGSDGGVKVWELSSTGYGSGQPPSDAPFGPSLAYTQGPHGAQPVHGRFIRDLVKGVQGVWRVRMDESRLVCAVQREGGSTWFEVLDFTDGREGGVRVEGPGDRVAARPRGAGAGADDQPFRNDNQQSDEDASEDEDDDGEDEDEEEYHEDEDDEGHAGSHDDDDDHGGANGGGAGSGGVYGTEEDAELEEVSPDRMQVEGAVSAGAATRGTP
ncbi:SCF ubiquitin ligase complex subunit cdc4 [Geranomyces michiganensis]|nr:SCF ubiquitin ligase complex subunit cdc4 [Geranomyces michiganensis]